MVETSIRFQSALRTVFTEIAELIAGQNNTSLYHCLHSDEGSAKGVLTTIKMFTTGFNTMTGAY